MSDFTVLAIMQNQWFRDPEQMRQLLEKRPNMRRDLVRRFLFAGCKSGRVLRATLGQDWCQRMVWEEASKQIGGHASSRYDADPIHLRSVIDENKPVAIVGFGVVACRGLEEIGQRCIIAPHPAARHGDVQGELRRVREVLERREDLFRLQQQRTAA